MDSTLGVIGPGSSTAVKLDLLQCNSFRMPHLWTSTLFVRLAQAIAALWDFRNLILVSRNTGGFQAHAIIRTWKKNWLMFLASTHVKLVQLLKGKALLYAYPLETAD